MSWVAEIEKHIDYFKDNGSNTTTFVAKTKDEAKALAVMFMMEDLADRDYGPVERLGSEELNTALRSRDVSTMYEALVSRLEELWSGEYVNPTLEVCIYERRNEYDTVEPEEFTEMCDALEEWLGA